MVSFPFLHLPSIPQEKIIRNFNLQEIFLFSLISKKCHSLAKRVKIHVENIKCFENQIDTMKETKISSICFAHPMWLENPVWELETEIDSVSLTFVMRYGCRELCVSYDTVKHLQNFSEVVFRRLTGILKVEKLKVHLSTYSVWRIPYEMFLTKVNFDCEVLQFVSPQVKSEDLRTFLSKWKKGWFPRLKEMSAEWEDLEFPWRMGKKIAKGKIVIKNEKGDSATLELLFEPSRVMFIVDPTD